MEEPKIRQLDNGGYVAEEDEPRYEDGVHRIPIESQDMDTYIEVVTVGCLDARTDRPPRTICCCRNDYLDREDAGAGVWGGVIANLAKGVITMLADRYDRDPATVYFEFVTTFIDQMGVGALAILLAEEEEDDSTKPSHPEWGDVEL